MGGIGGRASADWPEGVTGAAVGDAVGSGGADGAAAVARAADEGTPAAGGLVTAAGWRRRGARRVGVGVFLCAEDVFRFSAAATRPVAVLRAAARVVVRWRGTGVACRSGSEATPEVAGRTCARGACLGEAVAADSTEAAAPDLGFRPMGPAPGAAGLVCEVAGRASRGAGSGDFGAGVVLAGRRAAGERDGLETFSAAVVRSAGDFFRAGTAGKAGEGAGVSVARRFPPKVEWGADSPALGRRAAGERVSGCLLAAGSVAAAVPALAGGTACRLREVFRPGSGRGAADWRVRDFMAGWLGAATSLSCGQQ